MTDSWEERISHTSDVLLIGEHEARYAFARPVVESAGVWCDLGCGTATASSRALGACVPRDVVLVDADPAAMDEARRAFLPKEVQVTQIDLTSTAELAALGERLARSPGPLAVTCFEVIEHLADFVPIVEWMGALSEAGATVVLSVPNDVFTAVKNPFHVTMWGSSTVEEFRRLLPRDHLVASQTALSGSIVSADDHRPDRVGIGGGPAGVPLQYLMAFGSAVPELSAAAVVLPTDVAAQRVWERQREADNQYYRSEAGKVPALEAEIAELRAALEARLR